MKLLDLVSDVHYELVKGSLDLELDDITYDSRRASSSVGFVAIKGFRVNGEDYIKDAIDLGCRCIFVSSDVSILEDVTVVRLEDARVDLSRLSRRLFGYPDKEITLIGITGTKGKTTTSVMIRNILECSGKKCGLIGTMGVFYDDKFYHTMNTSPESYDVFKYMREMISNGVRYLVMEVSSQSLKLDRWVGVVFDYAIFTNLSLDHIGGDEHESFDDYKYCKSKLFKMCRCGIFNIDSEYASYMIEGCSGEVYTFGSSEEANFRLVSSTNVISDGFVGISMETSGVVSDVFRVSILGYFTSFNALAALSVCNLLGISVSDIKRGLENVSVRGRMESVFVSNKFSLIIDYAYQGIAMENVLKTIRESNPCRIVTVFGCGGNRSRQRRFDCGEVSGKYADLSIITADNPRYEDNDDIVRDILVGMKKTKGVYKVINDRKDAIRYAIENALLGDVILVLGKGHEDYQEIKGVRYPFDERVVIKEIIDELSDDTCLRLGIVR